MAHLPTVPAALPANVVGVCLISGYVVLVSSVGNGGDYEVWAALVVVPVLFLVTVPLLARARWIESDHRIFRLLVAALMIKALATVARYWMTFGLYDGNGDAGVYHEEGARLAESYRHLDFSPEIGHAFIGTGFMRAATGVLYAVTGPSIYVAYAVFAWLGYWGLYFLYRAFRIAIPDGDHRRYAILVLFLPSMVFWPAGLGKEAWMTFGIGLVALGTAKLLSRDRGWLLPLCLGLSATAVVRPHIAAALFAGTAAAVLLRRPVGEASPLRPLARAAMLVGVLGLGMLVVRQAATFLGVEELSVSTVDAAMTGTQESTAIGGSQFEATPVRSPLDLPLAAVSVLFRPFVFEAHSALMLVAAVEGTALLALLALSVPRLSYPLGRLRELPYLVFCLVYVTLFVYAFSSFSNFGILTRERVQVLPFVLVLLALPVVHRQPAGTPREVALTQHTPRRPS